MHAYNNMPKDELAALAKVMPPQFSGVEQSDEMLEWIWNNFSAVAGDQPSFECWRELLPVQIDPPRSELTCFVVIATQKEYMLHEVLLAGWGCPIGELFDLEKLAEHCRKAGRWSFFVTSEVCNVSLCTTTRRGGIR